jgi:hypothetical protein
MDQPRILYADWMAKGIPPPLVLSLLISDNHLVDARSNQHSVIGVISHVQAMKFPTRIPRLCVFVELTNARGKFPLSVRIVDADEARPPVVVAETELDAPDPLAICAIGLGMGGLVFSEPGEYRVQLLSGGELLLERRLVLVQLKPPEPPPEDPV